MSYQEGKVPRHIGCALWRSFHHQNVVLTLRFESLCWKYDGFMSVSQDRDSIGEPEALPTGAQRDWKHVGFNRSAARHLAYHLTRRNRFHEERGSMKQVDGIEDYLKSV